MSGIGAAVFYYLQSQFLLFVAASNVLVRWCSALPCGVPLASGRNLRRAAVSSASEGKWNLSQALRVGRDLTGIKVEGMACQRYESGGAQCVRGPRCAGM